MSTLCLKTPLPKGLSSAHVHHYWNASRSTYLMHVRFCSQSKQSSSSSSSRKTQQQQQQQTKKQFELCTDAPTPYPPTNPRFHVWVKQQHEQRFYKPDVDAAPRVRALFVLSGIVCGLLITFLRPTDFRYEWRFSAPLPDAQHTKLSSSGPTESVDEMHARDTDIFNDRINAVAYTACFGVTAGAMGAWWHRMWTRPLRLRQTNAFETRQTMITLCNNWHRSTIKGTFWGCSGVLAMIYAGVFGSYLFAGHFFSNKYVDESFWNWMELTYQQQIDSKREYEILVELEEREREKSFALPAPAPSITAKQNTWLDPDEYAQQQQHSTAVRERKRMFYDKTRKSLDWDTNLYLESMHIPYYKLDAKQKAMRWNMAREMAALSGACTIYIVLPIFLATTVVSVRAYYRFWWKLCEQISATKKMPKHLF